MLKTYEMHIMNFRRCTPRHLSLSALQCSGPCVVAKLLICIRYMYRSKLMQRRLTTWQQQAPSKFMRVNFAPIAASIDFANMCNWWGTLSQTHCAATDACVLQLLRMVSQCCILKQLQMYVKLSASQSSITDPKTEANSVTNSNKLFNPWSPQLSIMFN